MIAESKTFRFYDCVLISTQFIQKLCFTLPIAS